MNWQLIMNYASKMHKEYDEKTDHAHVWFDQSDMTIASEKEYYNGKAVLRFNAKGDLVSADIYHVHDMLKLLDDPTVKQQINIPEFLLKPMINTFLSTS